MSRQQHGNEEHAATATASAAIEADTNGVANTLATTHLAGTIVKTMAINAGSLKAAVNINKPKVRITRLRPAWPRLLTHERRSPRLSAPAPRPAARSRMRRLKWTRSAAWSARSGPKNCEADILLRRWESKPGKGSRRMRGMRFSCVSKNKMIKRQYEQ